MAEAPNNIKSFKTKSVPLTSFESLQDKVSAWQPAPWRLTLNGIPPQDQNLPDTMYYLEFEWLPLDFIYSCDKCITGIASNTGLPIVWWSSDGKWV